MRHTLDDRQLALVAETNDQRRCVGQALTYLHRTLLQGNERGRGLRAGVRAFAPGAAALFASLEARLRRLSSRGRDERLRRWLSAVLARLAEDLDRGDRMLVPFARWLEGRFPELTALMRKEAPESKVHDAVLAQDLALAFGACARAEPERLPGVLSEAAVDLVARG